MRRLQQNSQSQPYNTALLPTRCSGQTPLIHQVSPVRPQSFPRCCALWPLQVRAGPVGCSLISIQGVKHSSNTDFLSL